MMRSRRSRVVIVSGGKSSAIRARVRAISTATSRFYIELSNTYSIWTSRIREIGLEVAVEPSRTYCGRGCSFQPTHARV